MFHFFFNPWLLICLAGIALPILAHLLSRRRYEVVEWAAMRFLNPSRKTRRRLKLEELLLLLLRIGLVSLIALSAARPWLPGGWLSGYSSSGSRSVVVVIDGSNSMSRTDGVNSMHQNALRRAAEFLETLDADDSVALIDARDLPRTVIESPLRDLKVVAQEIQKLPSPGGSCAMIAAIEKAVAVLGRSSASEREIVVFTDRQANSWESENETKWARFDDLIKFPSVRPHVWVFDVAPSTGPPTRNISVGRIGLSREMTVPGFPVKFHVAIRNESNTEEKVPLRILLNGQPLAATLQSPSIPAHNESLVEFEQTLLTPGTHALSVEAESADDAVSVDNVSHVAIHVEQSLNVLLVNGTPAVKPADRASFFAELAFAPLEGKPQWVNARVVDSLDLKPADVQSASAVICCSVDTVTPNVALALKDFVSEGNGLIIACGPETTPESFQSVFGDSGLVPQLSILRIREAPPQAEQLIHVAPLSIQSGWLDRFHSARTRSFLNATFNAWCLTKIAPAATQTPQNHLVDSAKHADLPVKTEPIVLAALSTGDPLLLESRCGNGVVLVMTSTLDRRWNDFPTRSDFVPFLYEAVFHVVGSRSHRNVNFGEPLMARPEMKPDRDVEPGPAGENEALFAERSNAFVTFTNPDGIKSQVPVLPEDTRSPDMQSEHTDLLAIYKDTYSPGIYSMTKDIDPASPEQHDRFVVNYDHAEDRLLQLTAEDRARLITNDRVRFSSSIEDLSKRMYGDENIAELWAMLLIMFLLISIGELLLTRRTIRRGYGNETLAAS